MKTAKEYFNEITSYLRDNGFDEQKVAHVSNLLNAFWDAADSEARANELSY